MYNFQKVSQLIDTIYNDLGELEDELDALNDYDDDSYDYDDEDDYEYADESWDDEWCAIIPEEEYSDMDNSIDEDIIDESIKRARVVRGGKRVIKFKSTKKRYRVQMVNGRPKEVRMTPAETRKRKKGQRKGKRKRKTKINAINRKRKRSVKKRTSSMRGVKKQ